MSIGAASQQNDDRATTDVSDRVGQRFVEIDRKTKSLRFQKHLRSDLAESRRCGGKQDCAIGDDRLRRSN